MAEPFATVSELVRQLYAGVIESPPWQGFLQGLKRETGSLATLIMLSPPGSPKVNMLSTVGGQAEINTAYRDQLFALDPFVNVPDGQVTTLHEYFGAGEVEHNDYYTHFMRATWGVGFVLYADVRTAAGYTACLRLCRGIDSADFGPDARGLVELLVPHLRQAVEIFDRVHHLQVEETELHDALDRLGVASFLLDSQLRVMQPNKTAEALFALQDGLAVRNDRLVIANEAARKQLAGILDRARGAPDSTRSAATQLPEVIVVPRRNDAPPLAVALRTLRSPADLRSDHAPLVAVYVSRPGHRSDVPAAVIRGLLGVTPAEAELAARLARGDTIDAAARDLGVTRATARTQLYSIFRKTGLRRQSELVAVITQTAARLPQG
ncbi:MAG: helix-turn-helix transcriptional regulator [Steroidobacteraceae bacterium]